MLTAHHSRPNHIRGALTALLAGALFSALALPAAAQKKGGASDILSDAVDTCERLISDPDAAELELAELGWLVEFSGPESPFIWAVDVSRTFDDGSDVYAYVLIESYPSGIISYCSYDAQGVPSIQDFNSIGLFGLVEEDGSGIYGSWEEVTDDGIYFVQGTQDGDYFYFQVTRFSEYPSDDVQNQK